MMPDTTHIADTRAPASLPSWGWALRRAGFGLVIMLSVTALAAYVAYVSIDPVTAETETVPSGLSIGTPAAPLLRQR